MKKKQNCVSVTQGEGEIYAQDIESVDFFKYLSGCLRGDGDPENKERLRVCEGLKTFGSLQMFPNAKTKNIGVKIQLYEKIEASNGDIGTKTSGIRMKHRQKFDIMEVKCPLSMREVTIMNNVRNEKLWRRVCVRIEMTDRVDRKVLKWFGHVKHTCDERLAKQVNIKKLGQARSGWTEPSEAIMNLTDVEQQRDSMYGTKSSMDESISTQNFEREDSNVWFELNR